MRRRIGGIANNRNAIERRTAINILEVKAGKRIDRYAGGRLIVFVNVGNRRIAQPGRSIIHRRNRDAGRIRGAGEGGGATVAAGVGQGAHATGKLIPGAIGDGGGGAIQGVGNKTDFVRVA